MCPPPVCPRLFSHHREEVPPSGKKTPYCGATHGSRDRRAAQIIMDPARQIDKGRDTATAMTMMHVVSVCHHDGQAEKVVIANSSSSSELANLLCERFLEREREEREPTIPTRRPRESRANRRYPPMHLALKAYFLLPQIGALRAWEGVDETKSLLFISKKATPSFVVGGTVLLQLYLLVSPTVVVVRHINTSYE